MKGRINRLMPGDEIVVQIGVEPGDIAVSSSDDATFEVVLREVSKGVEGSESSCGVVGRQKVEVQGSGILKDGGWGEWVDDVVSCSSFFLDTFECESVADLHSRSCRSLLSNTSLQTGSTTPSSYPFIVSFLLLIRNSRSSLSLPFLLAGSESSYTSDSSQCLLGPQLADTGNGIGKPSSRFVQKNG